MDGASVEGTPARLHYNLALPIAGLLGGIVASMGLWWWRNRTVRDIALL